MTVCRPKRLLVTGGAGFIGTNFVCYWLHRHPEHHEPWWRAVMDNSYRDWVERQYAPTA